MTIEPPELLRRVRELLEAGPHTLKALMDETGESAARVAAVLVEIQRVSSEVSSTQEDGSSRLQYQIVSKPK